MEILIFMSISAAFNCFVAGWKLARAGLFGLIDTSELPPAPRRAIAIARWLEPGGLTQVQRGERVAAAMVALGPSYIKLGQFLSTRADLVGAEIAGTFGHLKDELPPFPTSQAQAIINAQLGPDAAKIKELSAPVAAASVAQVHKVTLAEQEGTFALKVLRPGIRQRFAKDIRTYRFAARLIEKVVPGADRLKPESVVDVLHRSMIVELDLRLEAAALSELSANTAADSGFKVPSVDWDLTSRETLATQWIDDDKIDLIIADENAIELRQRLAVSLVQSFLRHAVRDGFFHADLHEGNLFADRTAATLIAVDCGIMGRIGRPERRFLAEILYGFIRQDYHRIAVVHFEAGYVPSTHSIDDFAMALRAIGEPIHGRDARDISMGKLLGLLFEVTELFDMQTRPELILLQKTMVVTEGVARRLDPDFDMWSAAEPVVRDWLESELGVASKLRGAAEAAEAAGSLINELPVFAARMRQLSANMAEMSASGFRFDADTAEAIGRAEARHTKWGRRALWVIAISMAIIAWQSL